MGVLQLSKRESKNYTILSKILMESKYGVYAQGNRWVGCDELQSILEILYTANENDVLGKLNNLYANHPKTIELDKSYRQQSCDMFDEQLCNCFYPNIKHHDFYCVVKRERWLETDGGRNCPEYAEWRKKVFERDDYTCKKCGQRGGMLNAHHKKGFKDYPELRYDVENGITYCEGCHKEEHKAEES